MVPFYKILKIFYILFCIVSFGLMAPSLENKNSKIKDFFFDFLGVSMASSEENNRTFRVKEVLDGEWNQPNINISFKKDGSGVPVILVDKYSPPAKPKNPEAIQMILAFQLQHGKTRKDFAQFKKLDSFRRLKNLNIMCISNDSVNHAQTHSPQQNNNAQAMIRYITVQ